MKKNSKSKKKLTNPKMKQASKKAPDKKLDDKKVIEKEPAQISPEFEMAECAAKHFGFIKLPEVEVEKSDLLGAKKFSESHLAIVKPWTEDCDRYQGFLEEKIAIMRNYIEKKWSNLAMPLLGYYIGPVKGNPHLKRNTDNKTFNLEIIGAQKAIAEAMIIETAFVILKERYPGEEMFVEINSIGDKESMARFAKELQNYVRKEINKLPAEFRPEIKKDVFNLFNLKSSKAFEFVENAPKPMSFLSDTSRTHFKEVLEFLESLNIPYEINHKLIGSRSYCSETIFEIRSQKEVFAIGERYNGLAKKVWGKKDVPAIGVTLHIHPHYVQNLKKKAVKEEQPKFYFIQFGDTAKKRSLTIIESLRKAKIPVHQSLSKDKLSVQLTQAEKLNIPYIIMMGQKEAIENTVVVRHMMTRAQDTVEIDLLVSHIKGLR
ncbi:MAG: His/Gly/Thr/Pro-type tRNA ligase C-terminal domain-containing protein [Patescibacteria group bacterium]